MLERLINQAKKYDRSLVEKSRQFRKDHHGKDVITVYSQRLRQNIFGSPIRANKGRIVERSNIETPYIPPTAEIYTSQDTDTVDQRLTSIEKTLIELKSITANKNNLNRLTDQVTAANLRANQYLNRAEIAERRIDELTARLAPVNNEPILYIEGDSAVANRTREQDEVYQNRRGGERVTLELGTLTSPHGEEVYQQLSQGARLGFKQIHTRVEKPGSGGSLQPWDENDYVSLPFVVPVKVDDGDGNPRIENFAKKQDLENIISKGLKKIKFY